MVEGWPLEGGGETGRNAITWMHTDLYRSCMKQINNDFYSLFERNLMICNQFLHCVDACGSIIIN